MLLSPAMDELLAPATHSIHERKRKVAPLTFVRRVGGAASKGRQPGKGETLAQRKGRRYESRVRQWLAQHTAARCLWNHTWLEYQFQHETFTRRAQPDFVFEGQPSFVFEVKHTWTDTSNQLNLYVALLKHLGLDAIPVTLCRNLTPQTPRDLIVRNFDDLFPYSILMVRV